MVAALRGIGHDVRVVGPGFYSAVSFGGESRGIALLRRFLPGITAEFAELAYNIPAYFRLPARLSRVQPGSDLRALQPVLSGWRLDRAPPAATVLCRSQRAAGGGTHPLRQPAPASSGRLDRAPRLDLRRTGGCRHRRAAGHGDRRRRRPPPASTFTPNGIDPARFTDLPAPSGDHVVLGFVGFMRAWHGLDGVIAGLAAERREGHAPADAAGDRRRRPRPPRPRASGGPAWPAGCGQLRRTRFARSHPRAGRQLRHRPAAAGRSPTPRR